MNRVDVLKEKLAFCITSRANLENEYTEMKKGRVYEERKRIIKGKIENLLKEIDNFGSISTNTWVLSIQHPNEVITEVKITLLSDITSEEVISRMKVSGVNVISIKLGMNNISRFPRLK